MAECIKQISVWKFKSCQIWPLTLPQCRITEICVQLNNAQVWPQITTKPLKLYEISESIRNNELLSFTLYCSIPHTFCSSICSEKILKSVFVLVWKANELWLQLDKQTATICASSGTLNCFYWNSQLDQAEAGRSFIPQLSWELCKFIRAFHMPRTMLHSTTNQSVIKH